MVCVLIQDCMCRCQLHKKSDTVGLGQVQHRMDPTFLLEPGIEGAQYDFSFYLLSCSYTKKWRKKPHA